MRILVVLAASVFAAICTEVLPVGLLPQIGLDLGVNESRVGLLVSAYAVVVALGCIPLTAALARWPRRQVLCSLLGLYAVSNIAFAVTDSYWIALASRLLGGLAHAGFFAVVIAAAINVAAPGRAGRSVAIVMGGNVLALALGVPFGTAVGHAVGWRPTFLAGAVVMLVLAGLTALVLPAAQPSPASVGARSVTAVLRQPPMLTAAVITAVVALGHYTLYTYIAPYLLRAHVDSGSISAVLFGYGLAGIVGLALSGRIADRNPRGGLLVASAALTVCLVAAGTGHDRTVVAISVVLLWGIVFGSLPTLTQSMALHAVPDAQDAAPAMVNATFNVGIAGGGFIGARELLVTAPAALAYTGAGLAALATVLLIDRRPVRRPLPDK